MGCTLTFFMSLLMVAGLAAAPVMAAQHWSRGGLVDDHSTISADHADCAACTVAGMARTLGQAPMVCVTSAATTWRLPAGFIAGRVRHGCPLEFAPKTSPPTLR